MLFLPRPLIMAVAQALSAHRHHHGAEQQVEDRRNRSKRKPVPAGPEGNNSSEDQERENSASAVDQLFAWCLVPGWWIKDAFVTALLPSDV
jgi:hypothetical protein